MGGIRWVIGKDAAKTQQRTLKKEDQGPAETQMPIICDENSCRFGLRNLTGLAIYSNGVPERMLPSMLLLCSKIGLLGLNFY